MNRRQFIISRVSGAPVSDAELIADLKRVAEELALTTVTQRNYRQLGKYSATTHISRFGSWNNALLAAELGVYERSVSNQELLNDVRRVASEIMHEAVSIKKYREFGRHDLETLTKRFGSWKSVLDAADLNISKHVGFADEQLFDNILQLWEYYGRQPRRRELALPPSVISSGPYWRRFRSWTVALKCFAEYMNEPESPITQGVIASDVLGAQESVDLLGEPSILRDANKSERLSVVKARSRRTSRDPTLRLRWKVLNRDKFRCCNCGASPANGGTELHVDHVIAWSLGGETVLENLQTLCKVCNLGKGNLSL